MSDTRILDIIPENLKEKLISEVEDLIKKRNVNTSNEVSPEMKEYLRAQAGKKASDKQIEDIVKNIMPK